jgi:branched-subunit amino acid transport protein
VKDVWSAIAAMTVLGFLIKATGPVVLGGRELPAGVTRLLILLPAALLTALVVVQTFAHERELVLDARAAGVAAAVVAALLRRGMLVILLSALATTALVRAVA